MLQSGPSRRGDMKILVGKACQKYLEEGPDWWMGELLEVFTIIKARNDKSLSPQIKQIRDQKYEGIFLIYDAVVDGLGDQKNVASDG